ncbi:MAG: Hsp20/alpha crystallin family protein [Acidimicrobiia bacterium]|nr:Hsp20/alpha crystallin family protein [Acidimicrobiia bacterium]
MTNLVRFDPWGMLRDIERVFEDSPGRRANTWLPRIDVFGKENTLVVRAEVPGVDPDAIEVTVEGDTLTISGSRTFESSEELEGGYHRRELFEGEFKRTVLLPDGVDAESITATSKDGILEISVPKRPEVLPRKVTVDVQR